MDKEFDRRNAERIEAMSEDHDLREMTWAWVKRATPYEYSYHFSWLGVPVIQFPQDLIALQEIIWRVQPDLVVEAGIARGGSLIFHASMLELVGGDGHVIGVDVDIRPHARVAVEGHRLSHRITMIEGSSTDEAIVAKVFEKAVEARSQRPLVILDSNHTNDHVLAELRAYSPLVRSGSYLVVLDTMIEKFPPHLVADRPWGPGNNPLTAVNQFLEESDRFVVDDEIERKLLITVAPGGYLHCIKDE